MRLLLGATALAGFLAAGGAIPPIGAFFDAASPDDKAAQAALDLLAADWKDSYTPLLIDLARLMRAPRRPAVESADDPSAPQDDERGVRRDRPVDALPPIEDRGSPERRRLIAFLEKRTGKRFGDDLARWREWMWSLPPDPHPDYAAFKAALYERLDPRMRAFFPAGARSTIRLDEIDWGGVRVNGIPPLRYPASVTAGAAGYLRDSNVVFGLVVNGEARAYPRRILAWHEMATDRIGDVEMTIVYCTLCGTVMPFESSAGGRTFLFGTSGLLYRSNKLMFDEQTASLWSTFEGVPVVGPLAGSGLTLVTHPVVTTTWKEWRTAHPGTRVLSIETGYERDYAEGAAYREYFATDRLMFQVPGTDRRLRNKAEVLVMRLKAPGGQTVAVAIDSSSLRKRRVYPFEAAGRRFLVLTSERGANRVYESADDVPEQAAQTTIVDARGRSWRITEEALVPADGGGERRPRISAQRAFWFGWHAQFPETLLLQ